MSGIPARIKVKWNVPKKVPTEDGPALLATSGSNVLLGVFDGMGGAGARRVPREDGEVTTEAAIAAQVVHDSVFSYFQAGKSLKRPDKSPEITAELLHQQITLDLKKATQLLNLPVALLKGTLVRGMPTTMALSYCRQMPNGTLQVDSLWAGDSRIYLFTPKCGLQQLSRDDLSVPGDAFENIYNDSPISNVVNTTQPFSIHAYRVKIPLPAIVFCATDGCYGYLPTPQSFELHLLESLYQSGTGDDWSRNLQERVAQVSQDDSSIALAAFGWSNFLTLRKSFLQRRRLMRSDFTKEKSSGEHSGAVDRQDLLYESWANYKPQYEERMYTISG